MNQTQQLLLSIKAPVSLSNFTGKIQDSEHLFQDVVSIIQKLCEVDYCTILLFEPPEIIEFHSAIDSPDKGQVLGQFSQHLYQEYQKQIEQNQIFTNINQNLQIPLKIQKKIYQFQIKIINLIPLHSQQLPIGIFCLYSKRDSIKLSSKKLEFIYNLLEQSLILLNQKRTLNQQTKYLDLIKNINQWLNHLHLTKDKLDEILQQIAISFDVDQVLLIKRSVCQTHPLNSQSDHSKNRLSSQPQESQGSEIYLISDNPLKTDLTRRDLDNLRLEKGSSLLDNKFFSETKRSIQQENFKDYSIRVPIYVKGELFGDIILNRVDQGQFKQEEIEILKQISEQIGIAIYQIELQEQLNDKQENNQHTNEYFSNMTHELRAPLASILGFARMLQEQIYGSLNVKQIQYVSAVVSSGEHLMTIVNDLLDLSKIEANREELFLEKLAVEDLCLAALSIVQGKAEEQELELKLDIAQDIDFCLADQQRFKQILINLLSNAIKFTEQGSVTLKVSRQIESITFSVIDTGIGIPLSEQKKLFQPFQQVKNSLSRKHKGTGLGLALSQKLAQLHGGNITLVSEVGQGSCFIVELPDQS